MEDEIFDIMGERRDNILNQRKQEFITGCYEAYELLTEHKEQVFDTKGVTKDSLKTTVDRMLTYFLEIEDYEKCQFLKDFASEHLDGYNTKPVPAVIRELNNIE